MPSRALSWSSVRSMAIIELGHIGGGDAAVWSAADPSSPPA